MAEEEPPYYSQYGDSDGGQNNGLTEDGYVKVPEHVPESSSSPEVIDHEEERDDLEEQIGGFGRGEPFGTSMGNLDREPDRFPPPITSERPLTSYVPAVEDVVPSIPSPHEGSPARPGTKHVETPKATGYLSFLNAAHPVVLYLIYWRDPKLSALSLVLSIVVLLTLYINTFLHTLTLLLLAAMVVSLLYIVTKVAIDSFYNRQIVNPFNKYLEKDLSLSDEQVVEFARFVAKRVNNRSKFLVQIVFFANTLNSLKFMVVLFLLSYVTNYFDILTTLFLVIIDLYTIPLLYSKYQSAIDGQINNVVFKITNLYSRLVEKVPFLPKLKSD